MEAELFERFLEFLKLILHSWDLTHSILIASILGAILFLRLFGTGPADDPPQLDLNKPFPKPREEGPIKTPYRASSTSGESSKGKQQNLLQLPYNRPDQSSQNNDKL